ncbi:MAG: hypothetical protein JW891_12625, partial [Candidatus Lokiarchaeota archaeon]|nr:hypothetical protein [Candidatus Lokiarchaeota archaeon]
KEYKIIIIFIEIILIILFFYSIRKYLVLPRKGIKNNKLNVKCKLLASISMALLLFLLFGGSGRANPDEIKGSIQGIYVTLLIIPSISAVLAYFAKFYRYVYYSIFFIVAYGIFELTYLNYGPYVEIGLLIFTIMSLSIISIGIYYLIQFFKTHPLPDEDLKKDALNVLKGKQRLFINENLEKE